MVDKVFFETEEYIKEGKMVGLVGGDHSTSLGLMKAIDEEYESWGILQIDAHADLRDAYEGFTHSHASIMFNALKKPMSILSPKLALETYLPTNLERYKMSIE